jgi:tetratricopeptide (TPR) repeat protein
MHDWSGETDFLSRKFFARWQSLWQMMPMRHAAPHRPSSSGSQPTPARAEPPDRGGAALDAALAQARALLARDPRLALKQADEILRVIAGQPDAMVMRGLALAGLGRTQAATVQLRHTTERHPDLAIAWRALAEQLLLAGDTIGADQAFAAQLRASVSDPELRAAAEALCDNNLPVAERLLKQRLKQDSGDLAALRMLAELAARIGRWKEAEALLRHAIALSPGFTPARANLATVLYRANRPSEALSVLDRLMAEEPGNAAYRNLAAAALARVGNLDEAIGHFEAVLGDHPGFAKVWLSYGHSLKTIGRQTDSIAAYRRCLALEPGFGEAWWSLANLKTVRFDADDIAAMETALQDETLGRDHRLHLHFALGKAQEDAACPAIAFPHYQRANRLRRESLDYRADAITRRVDRIVEMFSSDWVKAHAGWGDEAHDPIFILGMPRAGSTLIEQILASHPAVEGTQELPDIQMLANEVAGEDRYPDALRPLDRAAIRVLGEAYLSRTRIHRKTDRPLFIDKMPNNWIHVGLIRLILPNARIIDARRHPLACCFSNFKQHFARGQAFSYDLADMARYYADYVRLMRHFDEVMPGAIHRLHYEAMVDRTEMEVRRLLDYLGLPFDQACLAFHETERAVRTASSEQVRRPIFRDGLDRWQDYAEWLAPAREILAAEIATYPHR